MTTSAAIYERLDGLNKKYEIFDENHRRIHFTNTKGVFVLVDEDNGAYTCARKKDVYSKWTKWNVGISFEEAIEYIIKNL